MEETLVDYKTNKHSTKIYVQIFGFHQNLYFIVRICKDIYVISILCKLYIKIMFKF